MVRLDGVLGHALHLAVLFVCVSVASFGQVTTRAQLIGQLRDQKAENLEPEELNSVEDRLLWFKDNKILERFSAGIYGFRFKSGGMATGEGFGIGPEYARTDLARGRVLLRAAAQVSTKGATKFDAQLTVPEFGGGRFFTDLYAVRHNYGGIDYFGPGPDSRVGDRTNYRYEDLALDAVFGVNLDRYARLGATAGHLRVNVGPGNGDDSPSADIVLSPAQAPGIDRQTNFMRYGTFAQFDYRDDEAGPRAGGNYLVQFDLYDDIRRGEYDFRQVDVKLEQYIPFFNKRRVIALRAKTSLTDVRSGQSVPFYLQPVVGGSDDLRGFRSYRFRDANSLVLNAEYRFETFAGLDTALFVDGAKVFRDHADLDFTDLEGSAGFGLRFNARNAVFLRIDVGFSHEGYVVWFKFNNIFGKPPIGRSSPEAIF